MRKLARRGWNANGRPDERGCGGRQLKLREGDGRRPRRSGARLLRARDTNARLVVRTATFYLSWSHLGRVQLPVFNSLFQLFQENGGYRGGIRGLWYAWQPPSQNGARPVRRPLCDDEDKEGGGGSGGQRKGRALRTGEGKRGEGGRELNRRRRLRSATSLSSLLPSPSALPAVVIRQAIDAPQVGVMPSFLQFSLVSPSRLNHTRNKIGTDVHSRGKEASLGLPQWHKILAPFIHPLPLLGCVPRS